MEIQNDNEKPNIITQRRPSTPSQYFATSLDDISKQLDDTCNNHEYILNKDVALKSVFFANSNDSCKVLKSPPDEMRILWAELLCITNGVKIIIKDIEVHARVQVTSGACLIAENCVFHPLDDLNTNSSFEILPGSSCILTKCAFQKASSLLFKSADIKGEECIIYSKNVQSISGSKVCFSNTHFFSNFNDTQFSISQRTSFELVNCTFDVNTQASRPTVYCMIDDKCSVLIYSTKMTFNSTRSISCINGSKIGIFNSSLVNSIINAESSTVIADNSNFTKGQQFSIHFRNSSGCVNNCTFPDFGLYFTGKGANPLIADSSFSSASKSPCVSIRDYSRPFFYRTKFSNCQNCFSISDFAKPVIRNSQFENFQECFLSVCNAAEPYFLDNIINGTGRLIDSFTLGLPHFIRNQIIGSINLKIHHHGKCVFEDNWNENSNTIILQNDQVHVRSEKVSLVQHDEDDDPDPQEIISEDTLSIELPCYLGPVQKIARIEEYNYPKRLLSKITNSPQFELVQKTISMCIHCNQRPAQYIGCLCCHPLFCEECLRECQTITQCPLCSAPLKAQRGGKTYKFIKLYDSEICVACQSQKPNVVFSPCGHIALCLNCSQNCEKQCPICRENCFGVKCLFPI